MALQASPFSAKRPLCGPEREVMSPVLRKLPQLGLRSATMSICLRSIQNPKNNRNVTPSWARMGFKVRRAAPSAGS